MNTVSASLAGSDKMRNTWCDTDVHTSGVSSKLNAEISMASAVGMLTLASCWPAEAQSFKGFRVQQSALFFCHRTTSKSEVCC